MSSLLDLTLGTGDIYDGIRWTTVEIPTSKKFNQWDSNLRRAINLLIETLIRSESQPNRVVPIDSKMVDRIVLEDDNIAVAQFIDRTSALRFSSVDPVVPDGWDFENGDRLYFGHSRPFTGLDFHFNPVSSAALTLRFQYYKVSGSETGWTTITSAVTDNTSGFTLTGTTTWTDDDVPDWGFISLNNAVFEAGLDPTPRFWFRIEIVSGIGVTEPKLDYVWFDEQHKSLEVSQEYATRENGELTGTGFVRILPGKVIVNGQLVELKEPIFFFIPTLAGSLDRFGAISIELGQFFTLITGNADCSPFEALATALQYKLADVKILPGQIQITDGFITDQRV